MKTVIEWASEHEIPHNKEEIRAFDEINQRFKLKLEANDVDTISGLMMARTDKMLAPGDRVELPGVTTEMLDVKGSRAIRIRLKLSEARPD